MQVMPYAGDDLFSGVVEYSRPASPPVVTRPGQAVGLYIIVHPDVVAGAAEKFGQWFARREEVRIVDVGTSDKVHLGFVLMEWLECDVDQLFLDILESEEAIADYTLFGRALEG
jgi:hypothetical protein